LKEFFGCGVIVNKNTKNEAGFRVNSLPSVAPLWGATLGQPRGKI
jgi:hypothetical protein